MKSLIDRRAAVAAALALLSSSVVAEKPLPVTVTNTPLPVTTDVPLAVNISNGSVPVTLTSPVQFANPPQLNIPNPLPTVQAFPRQPLRLGFFRDASSFVVPENMRLVIEMADIQVTCDAGLSQGGAAFISATPANAAVPFFVPIPLSVNFTDSYFGIQNMRLVLDPGTSVLMTDNSRCAFVGDLFGYLVSVLSPSLAP